MCLILWLGVYFKSWEAVGFAILIMSSSHYYLMLLLLLAPNQITLRLSLLYTTNIPFNHIPQLFLPPLLLHPFSLFHLLHLLLLLIIITLIHLLHLLGLISTTTRNQHGLGVLLLFGVGGALGGYGLDGCEFLLL